MAVTISVKDVDKLKKQLEQMQKAPKTVLQRTLSDVRNRGPGWIAKGVTQEYAVKAGEITGGKVGKVKAEGNSVDELQIKITGRRLTPTHFNMKPQAPKVGGSYTIKATIKKGERKTIGTVKKLTKKQRAALGKNFTSSGSRNSPQSPWMLSKTGTTDPNKVPYIPFQRREQPGKLMYVFRTLSLPQMVKEGKDGPMHDTVAQQLNDNIGKRLEHHMKLLQK